MEQLKAFIEKAKTDKVLAEKLDILGIKGAGDDEIIALAAEYGFTITKEEIENIKSHSCNSCKSCELKEEDLENVAGGRITQNRYNKDICSCYTEPHYYCVGFLSSSWCDHFRREFIRRRTISEGDIIHVLFREYCVMGFFDNQEWRLDLASK